MGTLFTDVAVARTEIRGYEAFYGIAFRHRYFGGKTCVGVEVPFSSVVSVVSLHTTDNLTYLPQVVLVGPSKETTMRNRYAHQN
jgi:hypothetical protein